MTTQDTQPARDKDELGSVIDVVERIEGAANGDKTRLEEITAAMGEASFVPVLMAPVATKKRNTK